VNASKVQNSDDSVREVICGPQQHYYDSDVNNITVKLSEERVTETKAMSYDKSKNKVKNDVKQ
jgi:hypothetical protein